MDLPQYLLRTICANKQETPLDGMLQREKERKRRIENAAKDTNIFRVAKAENGNISSPEPHTGTYSGERNSAGEGFG